MRSLIIGNGEIGSSLHKVFSGAHESYIRDLVNMPLEGVEILHIAFPYSSHFEEDVAAYRKQYKPRLVVIHSTVPVGTSRKVGAVNSPVNGRHPYLEKSVRTFKKVVGGVNPFEVFDVVRFFQACGLKTVVFSSPEASELGKLLCTRRYGLSLVEMKEAAKWCRKENVSFSEVYSIWNTIYNDGYRDLEETRFFRPNLYPIGGEIGGHCVIPNLEYVKDDLSALISKKNKGYKNEGRSKH